MLNIRLNIDTYSINDLADEITRVGNHISDGVEDGDGSGTIRDHAGNTVGEWWLDGYGDHPAPLQRAVQQSTIDG